MRKRLPFLPTCGGPSKTLSFRATTATTTTTTATATATATEFHDMETSVECAVRGLSSKRFFFNPGKTSSILEDAKPKKKEKEKESVVTFKESVSMMEVHSTDPFVDFKKSMQEMVEANEKLKEWENLQELLSLYLAVNDKINHGYIIGAFIDLLLVYLGSSSSLSSSVFGQEKSFLTESSSNNKNKMMKCSGSTESGLSYTSSSASSSGTCSSTCSHSLSSSSLEDEDNNGDDEDHESPQKSSDYDSSSKV